jgi:hypothetical protein
MRGNALTANRNNLELRRNRYALRLLTAVLFVTPVAMAQAPAAKPQPASSPESAAQTPTAASSQAEPQMQDQSAPPTESLGDAARKARTQKAKDAAPKVYTEDAVSKLSGHGVSVVGDGGSGSGGASSGPVGSYSNSAPQSSAGSQEQMWRSRARAIHDQMAQLDQRISGIKDEIAKYGAVQVDPQSGAQAGVIYIKDRNAEIERIEEQKTALQGQMDALEEEGRKAGADSGWFR